MRTRISTIILISVFLSAAVSGRAENQRIDTGNPDYVILDSVNASPGGKVAVGMSILTDDNRSNGDDRWEGIGSFCIAVKYDVGAMKADSVVFVNSLTGWDEKFTNSKIDTGFISMAGIYDLGGKDNSPLLSPKKPERAAWIYFSVNKKAKPGVYALESTIDPRQKETYLGSPDGVHAWTPRFTPGTIVIK